MINKIVYISTNPIYNRIEEQIKSIEYFCINNNIFFQKIITRNIKHFTIKILQNNKNTIIIFPKCQLGKPNIHIKKFLKLNNNYLVNLSTEQMCNYINVKQSINMKPFYNYFIDYSFINSNILEQNNIKSYVLPHLFYKQPFSNHNKKINVLFIGRFSGNRKYLYNKLLSIGIKSRIIENNCFGLKKINIFKNTKIVIDTNHSDFLNNPNPHRCIPALYYGCIVLSTFNLELDNLFYKFIEKHNLDDIPLRVKNILNNYQSERLSLQNKLKENYENINSHNLKFYKQFLFQFYKLLVIISSKNPNELLLKNIKNIINLYPYAKILIVDSDSTNFNTYNKIIELNLNQKIEIAYIKNKNFEYGAYKYGFEKYPNYDKYMCIQDSFIINKYIDINKVNDLTCYTYHKNTGYFKAMRCLKRFSLQLLENSSILSTYKKLHNKKFNQSQHNSFIISNDTFNKILINLNKLPYNKKTSVSYELIFGLFFIHFNYNTLPLNQFVTKIHGRRI